MPTVQGLPFATGSHTSYKAAVSIASQPKARATKLAHLAAGYRNAGDRGMTDFESARFPDGDVRRAGAGAVGDQLAQRPDA